MGGEGKKGRGDPIENESNKNEMRPSTWAVSVSVEQNFSVTLLQLIPHTHVSFCCITWNHTEGKQQTVVFVSAFPWRPCSWIVSLIWTERPVCNPVSILLLAKAPPALNKTSRHAVRDQLTLKLLDFTLKGPVLEMSCEFCTQLCLSILQIFRPCLEVCSSQVSTAWVSQAHGKLLTFQTGFNVTLDIVYSNLDFFKLFSTVHSLVTDLS